MPQVWEVDNLRASGIHVSGCSCTQHIMRHMAEGILMHLDGGAAVRCCSVFKGNEKRNALSSNTFNNTFNLARTRIEKYGKDMAYGRIWKNS